MSEEESKAADSQIEKAEKNIRDLEDYNFSWFKKFRRRYMSGRQAVTYNVSSVITAIQITSGSKIWAWLVIKAPWFTTAITKLWAMITTGIASLVAVFIP